MQVISRGAQFGANFYLNVGDGNITSEDKKAKKVYSIKKGYLSEITFYDKKKKSNAHKVFGKYLKMNAKDYNLIYYYDNGSVKARKPNGIFEKVYSNKFKVLKYAKNSCFMREKAIYIKNGRLVYDIRKNNKNSVIYYPNGKVYAELRGKVAFAFQKGTPFLSNKSEYFVNYELISRLDKKIQLCDSNYNFNRCFEERNWKVTIYDKKGKVKIKGGAINGQKTGEWIENYIKKYYLFGVEVTKKLYFAKPEELNGKEVLSIANTQLRASLLNKMGLERVIKDVEGKVIEEVKTGKVDMTLFSMPINSESPISDKEIRILKVKCPSTGAYYCLRVPPQVNTCEEARQWTFGKELNEIRGDKDAPKLESYMNFEKET